MSSSANGSPAHPRLGPGWYKGNQGKGFQPPPAVPAERRSRSGSSGSHGSSDSKPSTNKFSVLEDEGEQRTTPRFHRQSSGGGRSLADLAARTTATRNTTETGGGGSGRFSGLSSSNEGPKVIKFTRERLLSMRAPPKPDDESPPPNLKHLEGTPILSAEPQDPVCWDPFEPDEIWATVTRLTRSGSMGERKTLPDESRSRRVSQSSSSGGRWERGVALPPQEEVHARSQRQQQQRDADNPNDLWDDPVGGSTGAAADFSGFGAIPDDPKKPSNDAFDFDAMAEASAKFDLERHGSKGSLSEGEEGAGSHTVQVDPHRPLASAGTTIQSGSGDGVNVFEDFDDESSPTGVNEEPPVKSGTEDTSASSRLMKMIGVDKKDTSTAEEAPAATQPSPEPPTETEKEVNPWDKNAEEPKSATIPSNPWGSSIMPPSNNQVGGGLDLASRLEQVSLEQKTRDAQMAAEMERRKAQEAEMRRRQEEEAKRRAQQEQQQSQQQQQQGGHSQVELVLMERISTFLENSWGRSDLMSILTTLHAEDSRVIPLLGNVEALRALITRHPNRVGLRNEPSFGAEMAVLLLTNAQWMEQQQARAREEEMQRREQQRIAQQQQQRQQAAAQQRQQKPQTPTVSPDLPWFYSDPQNNVQGPFRGEEMRQWLEAGYFKGDLPISQQPNGPFVPLQALFPDLLVAFKTTDDGRAAEAAAAAAQEEEAARAREAEKERLAAEEREARAAAEAAAAAAAEAERREKEAAAAQQKKQAAAASKEKNQPSAQLKMMLGMSKADASNDTNEVEAAPKEKRAEKATAKANNKSQQQQRQPSPVAPSSKSPAPAASPAWGGAASAATRRKSISEIQQEEARAAARLAMDRQHNPRSSSGGWANVAASKGGSTGWSSGTVKPTPAAAVLSNPNAASARMMQAAPRPSQVAAAKPGQRQSGNAKQTEKAADDFGASMPPALEKWCKDQLTKLNGSDDLTLVSFCMTLTDPVEIRQYLTAYLGSTPQVNNFATEFINRKDGGKGKQDEWESAGKSKKGKKKK